MPELVEHRDGGTHADMAAEIETLRAELVEAHFWLGVYRLSLRTSREVFNIQHAELCRAKGVEPQWAVDVEQVLRKWGGV